VEFPVRDGVIDFSAVDGLCRVAALDRRGRWIANGVLEGYADRIEGIASTFNTALQIIVIGRNPDAMASAVNRVVRMGGGIAAIEGEKVILKKLTSPHLFKLRGIQSILISFSASAHPQAPGLTFLYGNINLKSF